MISSGQKYSLAVQQHNFTATKAADNFQNQAKKLPCHVTVVNNDDTVQVAFDITDPTFTLPSATYPQAFSKYSREPTQVGDKGYIVPNDVNLGGESGLGGGVANLFQRGNLTTGVFHPISNTNNPKRDQNQFLVTGGPSGHKTQTQDTSTYHLLDALNNIVHNSSTGIVHISGNLLSKLGSIIPIPAGLKGIVALAGNVLQGGSLPIPAGLQGILHLSEKGILHIADNALNSMIPANLQGIVHLAENAISHTSVNGIATISSLTNAVNLVSQQKLTIGGPSTEYVALNDLTTPPIPSAQTLVDIIGSLTASGNISAGGMISAGGFGGAAGGGFPGAGESGEVIYSNITTGVTISNNVPADVTLIQLTPGVWQVQGEIWFLPTAGFTAIYSAINTVNATFPTVPGIAVARSQIVFPSATPSNAEQILSLRPCYVNITTNTIYYLIAQAAFGGACTVMGNIWAVRI